MRQIILLNQCRRELQKNDKLSLETPAVCNIRNFFVKSSATVTPESIIKLQIVVSYLFFNNPTTNGIFTIEAY